MTDRHASVLPPPAERAEPHPDRYASMRPRLAEHAQRDPRGYRARVAGLSMLGYGILLGVILLTVAATGLTLMLILRSGNVGVWKLVLPLLGSGSIIVWAVVGIRIAAPQGIVLGPRDAPALQAEIERIRAALDAPAPYQVLIGDEMSVSVRQVPRFGVLSAYRTYVVIGLPLAAALTADEFRALLAHEYGHVSRRHGRAAVWSYRARDTWQVMKELRESSHPVHRLMGMLAQRYVPYLDAYTAVLRRELELRADQDAARIAGPGAMAAALCRLAVADSFDSQSFWPGVLEEMKERPTAPADVFRRMLDEAPAAAAHSSAAEWLAAGAGHPTEPWDANPSLVDRLAALGTTPELPAAAAHPSGAEALFGEDALRLANRLGHQWALANQFSWSQHHGERLHVSQRLAALESRAAGEPLPRPEARERILLTYQLHDGPPVMPMLRDYLEAGEDDAGMQLLMGELMLKEGDEAGLSHLKRAMALDPYTTTNPACAAAATFLRARGREADAGVFERRAGAHENEMARDAAERNVRPSDRFLPHGLDEAALLALSTNLSAIPGLKRALLVRKEVTVFPEKPCFVLVVVPVRAEGAGKPPFRMARRVAPAVVLPGTVSILEGSDDDRSLNRSLGQVPGAEIFRREPARAGAR